MSALTNLIKPAWYKAQAGKAFSQADAYYRPLFRAGSITPLWHIMIAIGTVMYTVSQVGLKQKAVQENRAIQKKALEEYYEKHGNPNAHH